MEFAQVQYGGDYNPEQWGPATWEEDARLMQAAGVNLVTLAVFAWAKLEPAQGKYDFAWLDQVMDLLYAHGVRVDLATSTAAPPAWLVRLHPEILPKNMDGVTLWHGSRRHYCPHSPAFQEAAGKITAALAEHVRSHPALALWHVDNELACHYSECFCETSISQFRLWLKSRYGSVGMLNDAWGTGFWSQAYGDWEEITAPRRVPATVNPAQKLDWLRFCSDSWMGIFSAQKAILKKITPAVPVTTNFMSFFKPVDYFALAAEEDIVSNDSYPDLSDPHWMVQSAMACDLVRSLKKGQPWLLMEQAPSQVNWRLRNTPKRPGQMRLGSYQALGRGANGILFFQWRASTSGSEKFHSAMLPHAGADSASSGRSPSSALNYTAWIPCLPAASAQIPPSFSIGIIGGRSKAAINPSTISSSCRWSSRSMPNSSGGILAWISLIRKKISAGINLSSLPNCTSSANEPPKTWKRMWPTAARCW